MVDLSIINLTSTGGNNAFNDVAGPTPGAIDLGLPFFFGHNVFVAIQGMNTPNGIGPYWAF
jgi:hypothetical protein